MEIHKEEKRQAPRHDPDRAIFGAFELKKELTGEFRNTEEFVVKNISLRGFNLQSNYSPSIGGNYQIYVKYPYEKNEFEVNIIHSRLARIDEQSHGVLKPGPVYAIGCKIIYVSETQKKLIQMIIDTECHVPTSEKK